MKTSLPCFLLGACLLAPATSAYCQAERNWPDFDKARERTAARPVAVPERDAALARLKSRLSGVSVEFDAVTAGPRWVRAVDGFLTGREGKGRGVPGATGGAGAVDDPDRATKAFLREHRDLFGHGPEALGAARVKRAFTAPHTGLRTVVWEQQLDGIPVFRGTLIAHTTRAGELVSLGSRFLPALEQATIPRAAPRVRPRQEPRLAARQAVAHAAQNLGEMLAEGDVQPIGPATDSPEKKQRFTAGPLKGDAHARLVWLPMSRDEVRLCWEVLLTSRARGAMFQVLVDAESGEALVRRCLTYQLADASFRVFTSDSPSPFSPGWPTPNSGQPPLTARSLVTLSALKTNASPLGWIADGDNETFGNNVDAHLDRDGNDLPDLPRPHGSPARVFDFPLNPAQPPSTYGEASVVQLFYWNNWMHDRLYELGFTEAAGNFQATNFGRGGFGGDAMLAQSQDGSGTDNANISVPPEGYAPVMQMFIFTGPTPPRDSSLDAEIVIHEYTHGLSSRRVGGGEGLFAEQSRGLGEGWSDFYALVLLAEPGDDLDGTYAAGAYSSYQLGGLTENYYFGIRRYPYSTDLGKNPLTFADIDPAQASEHEGVPLNPLWQASNEDPNEVHEQGTVWCVMLWEARVALVRKHGFAIGNELILQLVTDGMNLSPPDPNFAEARDGILQADQVLTGGANQLELWVAFAKRGLGVLAVSPSSDTTYGVVQSFEAPGDLGILPGRGVVSFGPRGGPFTQTAQVYAITNLATNAIAWSATQDADWIVLSARGGLVPANGATPVTVSLASSAYGLTAGVHTASVTFSNHTSGRMQSRTFTLTVARRDYFVESWYGSGFDLAYTTLMFTPDGSENFYFACREPATNFPTDPSGGDLFAFGDVFGFGPEINLPPGRTVSFFGVEYATFFVGPGFLSFRDNFLADVFGGPNGLYFGHFVQPRISTGTDIGAAYNSLASWKLLPDRVAVTFQTTTYRWGATNAQVELFFDGTIRMTFLNAEPWPGSLLLVGLSDGMGYPADYQETDLSGYGPCMHVTVPARAREGDGALMGQGRVTLPRPAASNLLVRLSSGSPTNALVTNRVTVPAGATEATFDLTIVDDLRLDGTQPVIIAARAPKFGFAEGTILAEDNETAALTLSLPPTVFEAVESGVFEGMVSMNATPASDITVRLSSSDLTELVPPASVVIPAGQTSAVFQVQVVNDTVIDGTKTTVLTAHVAHWTDGTAAVTVLEEEPLTLTLGLPPTVCEGPVNLFEAGLLALAGSTMTNLTVALASSHTNRLRVPPEVTIPAGAASVRFDLTLVDNTTPDPAEIVTLTASAPGWETGTGTLVVHDDETPSAPFSLLPESGSLQLPLQLRLSWQTETPLVNVTLNGDFETGTLEGWRIYTSDDEGASFYINAGRFDPYGPERPTPPYAGRYCAVGDQYFQSVISLVQNVRVPSCEGRVFLRWVDRIRNYADQFTDHQRYWVTVGPGFEVYSTQPGDALLNDWVEREVEITRFRGQSIAVSFGVEATLNYFTLFIDNVSVQAEASPNAIVFDVYLGTTPALGPADLIGTTTNTFLDTPALAPATQYYWQVVARKSGTAASELTTLSTRGLDHFEWSDIAPTQFLGQPFAVSLTARDELGRVMTNYTGSAALQALRPAESNTVQILTFSPATAEPFSNGVWSGAITFSEPVAKVFLRASDSSGVVQETDLFAVLAPDDIALGLAASPDPAALGEELTYTLTVTNTGPSAATNVTVTNFLASGLTFVSVASPDASCSRVGDEVRCQISRLEAGMPATIRVVVRPEAIGSMTNRASVGRGGADFYVPNNIATLITSVETPTLFIDDVSVPEGDAGANQARFTVRLHPATTRLVSVRFATSNETATAGSDYLATNGLVVFSGGETSRTVHVWILGDLADEDQETFAVNLFSPTNAVLGRSSAVGTITGYDPPPAIIFPQASAREGDPLLVRAYLTAPSGRPISLTVATYNYTARAPDDYEATVANLVFAPGVTNAQFAVVTKRDALCEGTEYLSLVYSNVHNVGPLSFTSPMIFDGDAPPRIALAAVQLTNESFDPPNRFIDPGERVTVIMTPRNQCEGRATNLVVALLPGGGVTAPSAALTHGSLGPGSPGHPLAFSFTAAGTNLGPLALTFEFRDGASLLNTQTLRLHLGPTPDFAIASLSTNGCQALDVSGITGSYYSGQSAVVASSSNLFYSGPEGLGGFPLENPGDGRLTGFRHYMLVSNLRTETVYVLADGENEGGFYETRVTALFEMDGLTGEFTGNRIPLRTPLQLGSALGLYSGYDRIVFHASNHDVYSISLPWGEVTLLGRMSQGQRLAVYGGNYWGVAEHFAGEDYLVYPRDSTGIVRKRVSDAFATLLGSFDNLGAMGAITVSVPRNRWGFATTSYSQFLSAAPTVGLCDAAFTITEEVRITSVRHEGSTVTIRFPTIAGLLYRLERASNVTGGPWTPTPPDVLGTGRVMAVDEQTSAMPDHGFFRLRIVR